jgi:hypothetical protein
MSTDHYIYKARRATDEEIAFAEKRFVYDSNLFVIDENDNDTKQRLSQLGLTRKCTMYCSNTDEELVKSDNDIPQNAECKAVAIRPDYIEYTYVDKNGKQHKCQFTDWDWEHRYTIISRATSDVVHFEEIASYNNEKKLTKLVSKYFNPKETNYNIIPKELLKKLYEHDWLNTEPEKDTIYIYHEWF